MTQSAKRTAGLGVALAACVLFSIRAVPVASASRSHGEQSQGPPVADAAGATTTRLADGRWLVVGGEGAAGISHSAAIVDPRSGATVALDATMVSPRSQHTATLLPDGTVLIVGGRGPFGTTVQTAELFDPQVSAFMPIAMDGGTARSGHTATLLSDGRLVIAGGIADGDRLVPELEVWDVLAKHVVAIGALRHARSSQQAALLADGRVAFSGGVDAGGAAVTGSEIFDPVTNQVVDGPPPEDNGSPVSVAASTPADAALDVPVTIRIALRFSRPLRVDTLTSSTVTLTGTEGPVDALVVAAEGGRLAFVTPRVSLHDDSAYTLAISGALDVLGAPLVAPPITFVTAKEPGAAGDAPDTETWTPDARSRANGWRTERPPSPWESLTPLTAPPGITAISGRVLTLDGRPLAHVALGVEGDATTESDRSGRFLLVLKTISVARRVLRIDGGPASRPARRYGFFEYGLTVNAGKTNVLPFTIWMPKLDTLHQITIPSPTTSEVVITTPFIPGLELHLPPGTTIRGEDGKPVTTLGITAIPVDRPPFPLAKNVQVPVYFTIQPGGGYVQTSGGGPKGGWLVYPNYRHFEPKQRIQFFHYDPDVKDWYVYGVGTANATQVVPDVTTRLYEFTGAMINGDSSPGANGGNPGNPGKNDPIDPGTGVFLMHKTDLYLPDVIPLALTRTYDSGDGLARPFGRGMTHPYAMFLWSANQYQEADLILPEGGKVHFVRTSAGTSWTDAVFVHQETQNTSATPTPFYKATMIWNGHGWDLTLKDGTVYVFGENAPLQAIRDRYGNQVTITHDAGQAGNVTRVTSPNGRSISFTYDGSNRITHAADNIGRTVVYTYDPNGNLSTVTDPENNVTTYTYDGSNQLATIKDGRNIVYLSNVYTNGRVTQQTLADPSAVYTTAYTLDGAGHITQTDITNPRGYIERLTFNSNHYIVSDVEALNTPQQRTTTTERQAGSNLVTATVDGLNRRTEYTYDGAGHVLTVKRLAGTPDAVTTTFTYEPLFNQVATITDPLSHTWTVGYDTQGKIASVTDPLTHQTVVVVNAAGQVTGVTDALQHTWQWGYGSGDLVSTTDPLNAVSRRFLDGAGRVLSTTDPLGRMTRMVPDKLNRVTTQTDPLGGQIALAYDPNGRVLSLTDPLTHTTSYTYDTSDRAATRTDPLMKTATYGYDLNDNLTQLTDRKGQVAHYQYDALDRVTLATYADASTTAYTYDLGDRLTQVVDSIGGTITRTYDGLDRLTSETTPEGSIGYTYDADGRRATMTVAGQTAVSYGYDDAHRLTSITQGTTTITMTSDDANRRSTVNLPNGIVATYGYDSASHLTSVAYALNGNSVGDLTYGYDAAGQRTNVGGSFARTGLPQALATATYDAGNRITTRGGQIFSYDPNGNLASDGLTSYTWSARHQLSALSGDTTASFAYDGVGRRRNKVTAGTSTNFLFDGVNLAQELSGGAPTANLLTGLGIDEVFMRTDGSGMSALLTDALGSTLELADASGTVQTHYTFEPFGATSVSGATSTNAIQFAGRENDGMGLYFNRARFYSPVLQRFTSEDPIGFGGGDVNLYAYTGNVPTSFIDPLGLDKNRDHKDFCDGWYREPGDDYVLGRVGSDIIAPGDPFGRFLENSFPASHAAATVHDNLVGGLTAQGWPDWLVNIPSMPGTYVSEVINQVGRSFGHPVFGPTCHP